MNRVLKKVFSVVLAFVLLLTGLPSGHKSYAAVDTIPLKVEYNVDSHKYDIKFPLSTNPGKVIMNYHGPDYVSGDPTAFQIDHSYYNGEVTVGLDLSPDHIYDLSVDVYKNNGDALPSYNGSIYYLADITFTGESFNIMAKNFDIEDQFPTLETDANHKVVTVKSGDNPSMRLKWKIPTLYYSDGTSSEIIYLMEQRALSLLMKPEVPISKTCFQIIMKVGHGSTDSMEFNTDYSGGNIIIEGEDAVVSGYSGDMVTDPDGFLSVTLDKDNGIKPGTEYEFTNIGIIFENAGSEQVPLRQTKLNTDSDNHFMVRNIDNTFGYYGYELSSIFTPIQMELTKVDTDKVEIRFKKITNGVYPELHYQIQYAPRIDDLFYQTNKWVKIPDNSIPASDEYGSEIVTINVAGLTHPEYYFRVVYYDSSSALPRNSSLCIDLRLLDTSSGKPPLPREIKAEAIYSGRKFVTLPSTDISNGTVEIPSSDLCISFEKPIEWKQLTDWNVFKSNPYTNLDYTFHIIISTNVSESTVESRTKSIGFTPEKEIYLPVKQKRVLVLGKKDFTEDPNDPNRIICTIPGDKLFYDYVSALPMADENNEDASEDGVKGDYPEFLVPNTSYYMQVITSRLEDNGDIYSDIWGDSEGLSTIGLSDRLSYTSPLISFTTWPLSETPVPMPSVQLSVEPETYSNPVTGEMTLEGISVNYNRVLTDVDWRRYTTVDAGRQVIYQVYLSRNPSVFNDIPSATDIALYPTEADVLRRSVTITIDGDGNPIMPNTVYYVKARSSLLVGGVLIGRSDFTAIKAITTPKIDTGGLDNVSRDPRAPSEFSIAADVDGELLLTDAWVTLNWLHAEDDVTYDLIATEINIASDAAASVYGSDPVNVNFLDVYKAAGSELIIDVENSASGLVTIDKLELDENGRVLLPIHRDFLRPNKIYYFSLRAVRNRDLLDPSGKSLKTISRWITIPVTTKMVEPPAFLESVKDLEIGFNIQCGVNGATSDSMEVYLKKKDALDSKYIRLNRSQFSCIKDGTTFYFRIYNLEPDQWYDVRIKNNLINLWYDGKHETWVTNPSDPVRAKTRDPFKEIEIRWEGQAPYKYFIEARTDSDADYEELDYSNSGYSDYGYNLADGSRIQFYREKTNLYVEENSSKFIYYAKIVGKPSRDIEGVFRNSPLKSNTDYYIKIWSFNLEESIHIGPVKVRTDFSQQDYDEAQEEKSVIDNFNYRADKLANKLYWLVDIKTSTAVRAIIKDDRVAAILKASGNPTVTVDLSGEKANASFYEILIPYKTLEAVEKYNSRLNLVLPGAEFTINRGSIDLADLKARALAGGSKEAMLLLRVSKSKTPKTAFPSGFTSASDPIDLQAFAVGSRLAYSDIHRIIDDILNEPNATGPFEYGILDRELTEVIKNMESYSFRNHTDLNDMIDDVLDDVELELSRYIKDIIDGGSGLKPDYIVTKAITSFPGKIGVKLNYSYTSGYITSYVNYGGGWMEPAGAKGYVMQVVIFRAEKPGQYAVVVRGAISGPGNLPNDALSRLSSRYDLTKVFGNGTVYSANPIKGEQAVMLYAVLLNKDSEIAGLTPVQKTSKLGIGDVMGAKQLTGYMDDQTSLSLAVKLYCSKSNLNPVFLEPSKTIMIVNGNQIGSRYYKYVVLGIDLDIYTLENNMFSVEERTTIGKMLEMMEKALKIFDK